MLSTQNSFKKLNRPLQSKKKSKSIKLIDLIKSHRQFVNKNTVTENIGDGFLCATNPIFNTIREEFLKYGYKFNKGASTYFAFPLMGLDDILNQKTVPVLNNFHWLESIERQRPGYFNLQDLNHWDISSNYLLHECAHCVANDITLKHINKSLLKTKRGQLMQIFICEVFAAAVEAMGTLFLFDQTSHYFYMLNSYQKFNESQILPRMQLTCQIGFKNVVKLYMLLFLYSCFLYLKLGKKESALVLKAMNVTKEQEKAIWHFWGPNSQFEIRLNTRFRVHATGLYLSSRGYSKDVFKELNFDPVDYIIKNPSMMSVINKLSDVLCKDLPPGYFPV
ncbi:MAG: hypothetical protein IPM57_09600 [Oligoflexia bacterium]|nr:hypothetical protein [Oligoflexia bacterium]